MQIVAPASRPAVLASSQPPDAIYAGLGSGAATVKPNFAMPTKIDADKDVRITAGQEAGATFRAFHEDAAVILHCDCGALLTC